MPGGAAFYRMRTTLKRGMGRAATFNGNGRAVLPPPLLEPMRRYRQPPPPAGSTGRLIGKVFGWIVLAILVVGSGLAGGLYLYGHETLNAIGPHHAGETSAERARDCAGAVGGGNRPHRRLRLPGRYRRLQRQGLALRHFDADPRRPSAGHAVDAFVPSRPQRADLLQCDLGVQRRPDQCGVDGLRPDRARSTPCRS